MVQLSAVSLIKFGSHRFGDVIAWVDVKRVDVVFALAREPSSLAPDYVSLAPAPVLALVLVVVFVLLPVLESKVGC